MNVSGFGIFSRRGESSLQEIPKATFASVERNRNRSRSGFEGELDFLGDEVAGYFARYHIQIFHA
jgi:hypothetical protein